MLTIKVKVCSCSPLTITQHVRWFDKFLEMYEISFWRQVLSPSWDLLFYQYETLGKNSHFFVVHCFNILIDLEIYFSFSIPSFLLGQLKQEEKSKQNVFSTNLYIIRIIIADDSDIVVNF